MARIPHSLMMKGQLLALSRRYQAALQKHLQPGPKAQPQSAHLGRQAVALGLETLDVARIHKAALAALLPSDEPSASRNRRVKRAGIFFTEAITPIEKTHRAGVKSAVCLKRQHQALARRTAQLAAANRHLRQGISQRKAAEHALKMSGQHYAKLVEEARDLEKHLQDLACQILSAQENERKKISHDLRDELAQVLLGLNVRLLTLKRGVTARNEHMTKEIANIQQLVKESVKTVDGFARRAGFRHEA